MESIEQLIQALEASGAAGYIRKSRWSHAVLDAVHIFGIALTVGAAIPLSLRLLSVWRTIPAEAVARVLVPCAATGLVIAAGSGVLLFSVRATEYADLRIFQVKLGLIAGAVLFALLIHLRYGLRLDEASPKHRELHAIISILCWVGALACGRLIAFVGD
ncbi:MAG: DUF6644 family protein [Pseudomonadota bacterium]